MKPWCDEKGCELIAPHGHQKAESIYEFKIPTEAQHKRRIRMLWVSCIAAAIVIFVVLGIVVGALFLKGYDSKKIVEVSTSIFQILVLSYGMGFFVPAFVTSLLNMWLGVQMSRIGIALGTKTAQILETLDKEIATRLILIDNLTQKAETILTRIDRFIGNVDNPADHPLVKKADQALLDIKAEASKLQQEVARVADAFGRPIKTPDHLRPPPRAQEKPSEQLVATSGNGKDHPAA